ncbi:MAG TPA: hypothetical protein VKV33_10255, partial [Streptosporangiaceae bacterium]|nr:hypothetical protein [Streptosporangiaceae bacterium]
APAYRDGEPARAYREEVPARAYRDGEPAPAYRDEDPPPVYRDGEPAPAYRDEGPPPAYRDEEPAPAYADADPPPAYRDAEPATAYGDPAGPGGYVSAAEPPPYDTAYGGPGAETAASGTAAGYGDLADPYAGPEPDTGPSTEPIRGPFEPPPGQPSAAELSDEIAATGPHEAEAHAESASYDRSAEPVSSLADVSSGVSGSPGGAAHYADVDPEDGPEGSSEKMEQIKDLYATVEAIGDDNVDKHFDQLLQRQRELISEYFKETGIGSDRGGGSGAAPGETP